MTASARTKVLYVVLGLGTGGAERSVVDMLPHLERKGVDVEVFCRRPRPGAQADLDLSRVRFSSGGSFAQWVWETRSLIKSLQPDVVHTALFEADIAGRVAAIGTGIPVLTSLVNMSYEPTRYADPNVSKRKLAAVRWIEGTTARRLNAHFHAITEAVAASAVDDLGIDPDKVTVVYRGRDRSRLGEISEDRGRKWRADHALDGHPLILVVGRQEYQKAQEVAVAAMPTVLRRYPHARLALVGRPGNATPDIERAITELTLDHAVMRTGHIADVGAALCAADVLVFPSRYEGLGGILIEALAMRTPIVASDIAPIREVLDGAALLAPANDPDAFGSAIVRTLEDPITTASRLALGEVLFDSRFQIEHVSRQMSDLYRRLGEATTT